LKPLRSISPLNDLASLEKAVALSIDEIQQGLMLSSCNFKQDPWSAWEMIAAMGVKRALVIHPDQLDEKTPDRVQQFLDAQKGWYFFHINYDLKNCFEELVSLNPDRTGYPELIIFEPLAVIGVRKGEILTSGDPVLISEIEKKLAGKSLLRLNPFSAQKVYHAITYQQYHDGIRAILSHIRRGDVYELNFCQEFFSDLSTKLDPVTLWQKLSKASPAPFSAFYRWNQHAMVSASPERFLCKSGTRLISQPIKGTIRRGVDPAEDDLLKEKLFMDGKERSENVMIVDLVRNDLSRVAQRASVQVPELFGIYTFPAVHQMISTVTAEIKPKTSFMEILRALFPMGSMTGAPKIRAMELIENYEYSKRGLYSGCVGYLTPEGDFDMNVIIRSLILNLDTRVASFQTGGAITAASLPDAEYSESMLKARMLIDLLEGNL
jgi:para-aminobenzoate synthetase component I